MKKMLFTLVTMLTIAATANAMSYEQARNEALFLTDKMAYELNLTDAQYEAAYEINLDYLMGVTSYDDVFGVYWERRNLDLSYILYQWQWDAFRAATYFYRPLYWEGGYWHFGIYARYPHRDYFYFGRPHFYLSYRGGHSWRHNGGRSYYEGRHDHFRPHVSREHHVGMRNSWDRGDYRNGHGRSSTRMTDRTTGRHSDHNRDNGRGHDNGSFHNNGGNRDNGTHHNNGGNGSFEGNHNNNSSYGSSRGNSGSDRGISPRGNSGSDRSTSPRGSIGSSSNRGSFGSPRSSVGSSSSSSSRGSFSSTPNHSSSRGSFSSTPNHSSSRGSFSSSSSVSRSSNSGMSRGSSMSRGSGSMSRGGGSNSGGHSHNGGGRR